MISWRTFAGGALALLLFEVLLRQLTFGQVSLDPRVGWMWRSTTVVHRLGEGWGVSHWRDDETRAHPPVAAAAPRVLVIGDSFVEALQVDDDEAFSARLRGIDGLNIGQSGHSAPHYVVFAPEYLRRYRPAWTIIELAPSDLAEDAYEEMNTHFDSALGVHVYIRPPHVGGVYGLATRLRQRSDLIDYALLRQLEYRTAAKMPRIFRAADAETGAGGEQGAPQKSWPVAEELALLRDAYAGRVTFLFVPPFDDPPTAVEIAFEHTCRGGALSCVNLRSAFADFRARGDAPYGFPNSKFGEGHLNARGHAAAARLLDAEIERLRARGLF